MFVTWERQGWASRGQERATPLLDLAGRGPGGGGAIKEGVALITESVWMEGQGGGR